MNGSGTGRTLRGGPVSDRCLLSGSSIGVLERGFVCGESGGVGTGTRAESRVGLLGSLDGYRDLLRRSLRRIRIRGMCRGRISRAAVAGIVGKDPFRGWMSPVLRRCGNPAKKVLSCYCPVGMRGGSVWDASACCGGVPSAISFPVRRCSGTGVSWATSRSGSEHDT